MRFFLLPLVFVAACSSGGSSSELPPIEQVESFLLVRGDVPTQREVTLLNPLDEEAVVELVAPPGSGFSAPDLYFPAVMLARGTRPMTVTFLPGVEPSASSSMRVRFVGRAGSRTVEITFSAAIETPAVELLTASLDFGDVLIGASLAQTVRVRNLSEVTPVRIARESATVADFGVSGLSTVIAPGAVASVAVTFEPTALGSRAFDLIIESGTDQPALVTSVTADSTTWIPVIVSQFLAVPIVAGETGWMEVEVPAHAISISLEALAPASTIGLLGFEGPGGIVYENDSATGDLLSFPGHDLFTANLPASDRPGLRLVPGGGTYRFRFWLLDGSAGSMDVRVIVNNRPGGISIDGVLDLNVFVAPGTGLTAATAPDDVRLGEILDETDRILQQQGIAIGEISYYELTDPAYDWIENGAELGDVLAETSAATDVRLNLLFVSRVFSGGVLGVAARLGGPKLNGTRVSGVLIDYDFGTSASGAFITAHESGHMLGLLHTTERSGSFDLIDDTAECPPTGTNAECTTVGNDNLMHWSVLNASPIVTDGQGLVLRGHPLISPAPPAGPNLASRSSSVSDLRSRSPLGAVTLPAGWCGTADHAEKRE